MKALKIIGIIILILAGLVFASIQFLPDEAHLSRSVTIDASPDKIYQELITFKNFNAWSPWAAKDTATVYTHEGPVFGVGSKMSWASENDQVGTGSMEIVEANENTLVKMAMKFGGFDSSPTASFIIEEVDGGSSLSWTYDELGVSGFNRIFASMMDKFLGPDYEAGLQNFKKRIESAPKNTSQISFTNVDTFDYLGIASTVATNSDMDMISIRMAQNYGTLMGFMGNSGLEMSGYPIAIYTAWSPEEASFICGIPVAEETTDLPKDIERSSIQAGIAFKAVHLGDYMEMESTHMEIDSYVSYAGFELVGAPWEEYVTDPTEVTDTSQWITNIYYPVQ